MLWMINLFTGENSDIPNITHNSITLLYKIFIKCISEKLDPSNSTGPDNILYPYS